MFSKARRPILDAADCRGYADVIPGCDRRYSRMLPRDEILQQALALPLADRLYVADALEQSLADLPPPEGEGRLLSEAEFIAELERRSAAYRDGTMGSQSADEVLAELRRRQAREFGQ
ncbi:MAG: addiction module protein [Pirellulales bacterium]|nr:addiction module protein [Pirellulales bacterium]